MNTNTRVVWSIDHCRASLYCAENQHQSLDDAIRAASTFDRGMLAFTGQLLEAPSASAPKEMDLIILMLVSLKTIKNLHRVYKRVF